MSPNSPILLEVDDYTQEPNIRRARSNGYLDFLQEQEEWDRREQRLQMTRYRDRGHYGASQQRPRTGADRLAVPTYEVSPRRPRASSDGRSPYNTDRLTRDFKTMEVRPERVVESDARYARGSTHSRPPAFQRPKAPPVVIQHDPPPASRTPSPSGQPQLQYKYWLLQNKLADISSACVPFADVEAARPGDLTFAKIAEQVKGFSFDLQVWSYVSNIENMARIDDAVVVAEQIMDRMTDRAVELIEVCKRAKPGDLRFEGLEKLDDGDDMFNETDDDQDDPDPPAPLGSTISSNLHSMSLQLKNLKRLTRALQDATPDAKQEMDAVAGLVSEVGRYFGTKDALERFAVERRFAGRRALEEARRGDGR